MKQCSLGVILIVVFCINAIIPANAQVNSWLYLPNIGYDIVDTTNAVRTEDIYFTDTLTGFGVTLTGYILKTTDGGVHWDPFFDTYNFPDYARFRSIEFLADGQTGIAGSLNGHTFRTTDAGATWVSISDSIHDDLSLDGPGNICGLAHLGNTFYGVGWWGGKRARFYKSSDKGVIWQTTYLDTTLATNLVDVYFTSPDTGFATGGINASDSLYVSTKAVVLKTVDGGAHWAQVFADTTIGGRIWKIQYINPSLMVGSMEPYYDPDTVNMIRSTDGGNTWSIVHVGRTHSATFVVGTQGIGFLTPLHGFMGGYYTGMFETTDGGVTWDTIPFGVNVNRIFILDSTHAFAGGRHVYKWGNSIYPASVNGPAAALRSSNTLYPVTPNPAKGDVTITFDIGRETNVALEVASVATRRAERLLNKRLTPGHYTCRWNSSNAANGNYVIWLGTDEIPLAQKFVLER